MKKNLPPSYDLDDQAAEWVIRLEDGLNSNSKTELEQWLKQPGSQEALARYKNGWKRFGILTKQNFESEDPVFSENNSARSESPKVFSRFAWGAGLAALFALSFAGIFLNNTPDIPSTESQMRSLIYEDSDLFTLEDGSTVELNENTVIDFAYTAEYRKFWVRSGEVYFTVEKDYERPFDVYAGGTRLRALGTEFNVKYAANSVEVLITEGSVQMSVTPLGNSANIEGVSNDSAPPQLLVSNQKAIVHRNSNSEDGFMVSEISQADISESLSWKPITLKFDSVQLADAVEAFNRYNKIQLIIADPQIASIEIVATFRSNKVDGFVSLLSATFGIEAEYTGEAILLRGAGYL